MGFAAVEMLTPLTATSNCTGTRNPISHLLVSSSLHPLSIGLQTHIFSSIQQVAPILGVAIRFLLLSPLRQL
jgi:hypothetical protein